MVEVLRYDFQPDRPRQTRTFCSLTRMSDLSDNYENSEEEHDEELDEELDEDFSGSEVKFSEPNDDEDDEYSMNDEDDFAISSSFK